jgi:hypothetical protein
MLNVTQDMAQAHRSCDTSCLLLLCNDHHHRKDVSGKLRVVLPSCCQIPLQHYLLTCTFEIYLLAHGQGLKNQMSIGKLPVIVGGLPVIGQEQM